MTKSGAYNYGHQSGSDAFHQTKNESFAELEKAYHQDDLGDIVSQILQNWAQMADTIYYQGVSDEALDAFEEGFYHGFVEAAEEYFRFNNNPLTQSERRRISREASAHDRDSSEHKSCYLKAFDKGTAAGMREAAAMTRRNPRAETLSQALREQSDKRSSWWTLAKELGPRGIYRGIKEAFAERPRKNPRRRR